MLSNQIITYFSDFSIKLYSTLIFVFISFQYVNCQEISIKNYFDIRNTYINNLNSSNGHYEYNKLKSLDSIYCRDLKVKLDVF